MEFLRSVRFARLRGVCYMLFGLFVCISILSFLISGASDSNVLGTLGHGVARFFTNRLFGVASLGLALLIFLYGLRLWNVKQQRWWRFVGIVFFWMIWCSCLLGYVSGMIIKAVDFQDFAGLGYTVAVKLDVLIHWGTPVLLIFVAVVFLIFVHKVRFPIPDLSFISDWFDRMQSVRDSKSDKSNIDSDTSDDSTSDCPNPGLLQRMKAVVERWRGGKNSNDDDVADEPTEETNSQPDDAPKPKPEAEDAGREALPEDIDEAFEEVNRRAQSQSGHQQTTDGEPTFTIVSSNPEGELSEQDDDPIPAVEEEESHHFTIDDLYDPHLDLSSYQSPSTDILEPWERSNVNVTNEELIANNKRIVNTLKDYGIEIVEVKATPGPTVTLYEIKPAAGVRISRIKNLEDDIALSLSALGIRIIAPIPGKGTIGIEVPNAKPQVVSMKSMLESSAFRENKKNYELPIAIGKTISDEPFITDLAKMPHLLMAGATGTGKSVGLNAVIASLLYKKHPSELKFVMVDPKKVELSLYNKIERHYLAKLPDSDEAIITDVRKVVRTLNSLCIEMDQRYDLLKLAQVRKTTEYNDKFIHRQLNPERGHRYLPYIVLVIDEFADLIMTAGKEVEGPICRLAQLARAVGIHLIIATQRPTTNIITGTIKANFPARIAFKVTSAIDSRTILDTTGAQRLIGRGDLLISLSGSDMVRLQCPLIETSEIDKMVDFIGCQRGYPDGFLLPEYLDENDEPNKDFDPKQKDELFNEAARLIVTTRVGSTSNIQRKMNIGFNRAGRIIDQLEAAGIVGPANGSKPREVLIRDEVELEEILRSL
ncbi:MAG: DNA translocase FtsK [Bacteroidales bacterium]|nr:DNA translocase FtsK [Candidatus Colimorpha onthohippi]